MSIIKSLLGALYTPEIEQALAGKELAVINDGSYIPKAKFDAVNEKVKTLEEQVKTSQTQLETLRTAASGNEELQKQIKQLQEDNANKEKEWADRFSKMTFDNTLDAALSKAKAKNIKAVRALLDVEKIKLDGETLLGLEDQLKALQKETPYLFGDVAGGGGGGNPPNEDINNIPNPYMPETFNLTNQARLEVEKPELAKKLAAAAGVTI